nr:hypothetical protein [Selenomonas ruminantium]
MGFVIDFFLDGLKHEFAFLLVFAVEYDDKLITAKARYPAN